MLSLHQVPTITKPYEDPKGVVVWPPSHTDSSMWVVEYRTNVLGEDAIRNIVQYVRTVPDRVELCLVWAEATDDNWARLLDGLYGAANLRSIRIRECYSLPNHHMSNFFFAQLTKLIHSLPAIECIDVYGCRVTDLQANWLTMALLMVPMPELHTYNMERNSNISNGSLPLLFKLLERSPKLKNVNWSDCKMFDVNLVARLASQLESVPPGLNLGGESEQVLRDIEANNQLRRSITALPIELQDMIKLDRLGLQ